ncbi:MAG: hypothetical protein ABIN99_06065 [Nitrosospira sp.]
MNQKKDTTQPPISIHMVFSAELALRDIHGLGIQDVQVIVTDKSDCKHFLTLPVPTKMRKRTGPQEYEHAPRKRIQEERKSSGETQEQYLPGKIYPFTVLSVSAFVIPPDAQEGEEYTDVDGCVWLVESVRLGADDKTEISARCIGTEPDDRDPQCPHVGNHIPPE